MSSPARRAELRAEQDAALRREYQQRQAAEAEFQARFGELEATMERLGISPYDLAEWIAAKVNG